MKWLSGAGGSPTQKKVVLTVWYPPGDGLPQPTSISTTTISAVRAGITWMLPADAGPGIPAPARRQGRRAVPRYYCCLLYTSDAADDLLCVDLGGRRII